MRLYICADGSYAGTQADAKAKGRGWREVDVPTDKAGLLAYLNEGLPAAPAIDVPVAAADVLTSPPVIKQVEVVDLTMVEEFIQSSTAPQLARLADNVCWRMKELMDSIKK